jgi:hypothetical protein
MHRKGLWSCGGDAGGVADAIVSSLDYFVQSRYELGSDHRRLKQFKGKEEKWGKLPATT